MIMTPKEYLSQYGMIERRIQYLEQWEERWHRREMRITPQYGSSSVRSSGTSDPVSATVTKICRVEEEILFEIDRAADLRSEIAAAIAAVPDPAQREVLERKYIGLQTARKIGEEMGYSEDYVNHLHGWGLQKIVIPDNDDRS